MRYPFVYFLTALIFISVAAYAEFVMESGTSEAVVYPPGREPMVLPPDFQDSFVHYATIDRVDGISRNFYISPHAIDALLAGEELPERTIIVVEAFFTKKDSSGNYLRDEQGRYIQDDRDPEIHISERRTTWRVEDLRTGLRPGDWNFGAFEFGSGAPIPDNLNDCFSCHEGAFSRDFVFSRPILMNYVQSGEVQYLYCSRPGRAACR